MSPKPSPTSPPSPSSSTGRPSRLSVVNDQLSGALNSRITIEQAKGMVAEAQNLSMEQAFLRLRTHTRNHNLRLGGVARSVVDGELAPTTLGEAQT